MPAAIVLTLILHRDMLPNQDYTMLAFDWSVSFSWWLEALAFVPQIVMLNRMREIENLTKRYVFCLGLYRFFYILNWIYRYEMDEP